MTPATPSDPDPEHFGEAWVTGQPLLDAQLAPFGALAIDAAGVRPGERVLDVGCGCGATTEAIAGLVGPSGRVVGVDPSRPVLDRSRERIDAAHVELLLGDAATVELPRAAFDLLFSRFGVMFFADPVGAFAHLRRACADTGRLSAVVWQPLEVNGWVTVPAAAVADLVEVPPLGAPGEPGPFAFGDPDHVRSVLEGAGWTDVALAGHELDLVVGGGLDLDATVAFSMDHGPLRRVLADAPADLRAAAAARLRDALAPLTGPDGVRVPAAVWVVTASA